MKSNLNRVLNQVLDDVPRALLEKLIARKFAQAGAQPSREAIRQLAGRLIAGKTDVRWDEDGAPDVAITFSDSDVEALTEALDSFVGKDLPKLTENVSLKTARRVLRRLKKNWPERALWEEQTQAAFEARLAHRWGKGLDLLRMLLTISREFGEEAHAKARRSRARSGRYRTDVLLRLHACAYQVAGEIVKLMQSGRAWGAKRT